MTQTTGFGSKFWLGDGAGSETYTSIGEVISITPSGKTREAVATTTMGSTQRYATYIGGMRDGGEYEVVIAFDPGDTYHDLVEDAFNDNDTRGWRETFPDTSKIQGQGLVTKVAEAVPMEDRMTLAFTVKVSGVPEFTDV